MVPEISDGTTSFIHLEFGIAALLTESFVINTYYYFIVLIVGMLIRVIS